MGSKNLYIPANEEKLIEQLEAILKDRKQSLSDFFISAARTLVNSIGETEEIVLESEGLTRKLRGRWVYSYDDQHSSEGVILTRRGKLVYWRDDFGVVEPSTTFRVFDDLDELSREVALSDEALAEIASEIGEQLVQELDI